jgi:hypothetical protein
MIKMNTGSEMTYTHTDANEWHTAGAYSFFRGSEPCTLLWRVTDLHDFLEVDMMVMGGIIPPPAPQVQALMPQDFVVLPVSRMCIRTDVMSDIISRLVETIGKEEHVGRVKRTILRCLVEGKGMSKPILDPNVIDEVLNYVMTFNATVDNAKSQLEPCADYDKAIILARAATNYSFGRLDSAPRGFRCPYGSYGTNRPFEHTLANEYAALAKRVFGVQNGFLQMSDVDLNRAWHFVGRYYPGICVLILHRLEDDIMDRWFEYRRANGAGAIVGRLQQRWEDMGRRYEYKHKYSRRKAFVKADETLQADKWDACPRLIQAATDEANLLLGPSMWLFSKEFAKEYRPHNSPWCYASGLNPYQIGNWFGHSLNQGFSVCAIEIDYSGWDGSLCHAALSEEAKMYDRCGLPNYALAVVRGQVRARGRTRCGISYHTRQGRKSGDPNTSVGNSMINIGVHAFLLEELLGLAGLYQGIVLGDDALILLSVELPPGVTPFWITEQLAKLGLIAKVIVRYGIDVYKSTFCSSLFWPCSPPESEEMDGLDEFTGYVLAPKPGRVLSKFAIFSEKRHGNQPESYYKRLAKGVAYSMQHAKCVPGLLDLLANCESYEGDAIVTTSWNACNVSCGPTTGTTAFLDLVYGGNWPLKPSICDLLRNLSRPLDDENVRAYVSELLAFEERLSISTKNYRPSGAFCGRKLEAAICYPCTYHSGTGTSETISRASVWPRCGFWNGYAEESDPDRAIRYGDAPRGFYEWTKVRNRHSIRRDTKLFPECFRAYAQRGYGEGSETRSEESSSGSDSSSEAAPSCAVDAAAPDPLPPPCKSDAGESRSMGPSTGRALRSQSTRGRGGRRRNRRRKRPVNKRKKLVGNT